MISNENFFKQENVFWSFYLRYLHLVRFLFLFHDCNRLVGLHVFSNRVHFFFLFRLVIYHLHISHNTPCLLYIA